MWHLSVSPSSVFSRSAHQPQTSRQTPFQPLFACASRYKFVLSLLGGVSVSLLPAVFMPSVAQAQSAPSAPTVRYAQGEAVGLAEIIAEWRGYYADVPVYLCTCQEDTCNQTQQWPYREYDRYQMGVALGPTNGKIAEASGANCFDIADGSQPNNPRSFSSAQIGASPTPAAAPPTPPTNANAPVAPPRNSNEAPSAPPAPVAPPAPAPVAPPAAPVAPPAQAANPAPTPTANQPVPAREIPTVSVINNGEAIRLAWPSGASDVVTVRGSDWNVNVLNALDCQRGERVKEKTLTAQRVVGEPAVNGVTGNVAVPVLLESCMETDQSAVFILDPTEGGGYALYRAQLPGGASTEVNRDFPNEFSTYGLSSLKGLRYWDGSLLVRHGSASGAEALVIFRTDSTPAGVYAGCGITLVGEGSDRLCPE
jgi:hypothetical protein